MKIEMGWPYWMHGRKERCVQSLVEGPEGKRPLGRPCRRVFPWNLLLVSSGGCLKMAVVCLFRRVSTPDDLVSV